MPVGIQNGVDVRLGEDRPTQTQARRVVGPRPTILALTVHVFARRAFCGQLGGLAAFWLSLLRCNGTLERPLGVWTHPTH